MIEIKPIEAAIAAGIAEPAQQALSGRFAPLAHRVTEAHRPRGGTSAELQQVIDALAEFLETLDQLDREYGDSGEIPLDDVGDLVDYCIRCLAEFANWLDRLELPALKPRLDQVVLGVALWAIRHQCEIATPQPAINALARTANEAGDRRELAAIFALMQGLIGALPQSIRDDREKSDPLRPWRVLALNFAIVAVRTQDAAMMRYAFAHLEGALPDECAGFFTEALARATSGDYSPEVRACLQDKVQEWTAHR